MDEVGVAEEASVCKEEQTSLGIIWHFQNKFPR